ncbi:hypothetical protein [Deinococcus radiophilus]|uniref:hypothetical protein n=1 Tax=Deinococcus radiophilus TaxID=32062 RepID=UPI0036072121
MPGQTGNNTLTQPRVGKSPGMTRVVVDLPPGASYQIMPQGSGLNVQISGVRAQAGGESSVSPELKSWAYRASGGGISLSLSTGSAATAARGWRAFFLPPVTAARTATVWLLTWLPHLPTCAPLPTQSGT